MAEKPRRRFDDDDEDEGNQSEIEKRDELAKLEEYLTRAQPMIMQVHQGFTLWAAGVESKPPTDRWTQLKFIMNALEAMAKPTPAYRYRFETVHNLYYSYKSRWERVISDVENGRIKRPAGPKRGGQAA